MKTLTATTYEARLIHLGEEDARQIVSDFEQLANDGVDTPSLIWIACGKAPCSTPTRWMSS